MSDRLDRTSVAAILLAALGTFLAANAAIGIAAPEWYEAIVLDVIDRSLGAESSAYLEATSGFTTLIVQVGWIVGLLEGLLNWFAAAALLMRGQSWGRIAGLVMAAVGLFGAATGLVTYVTLSDWTAPMPAFAWLEPDLAIASSLAANALAAAGYAAILVLLGRRRPASEEGSLVVAN